MLLVVLILKKDTLGAVIGSRGSKPESVVLEEGWAQGLPTPDAPEGWIFLGWATGDATTMWWNKSEALEKEDLSGKYPGDGKTQEDGDKWFAEKGPEKFKSLKNVRSEDGKFSRENYWSRLVGIPSDAEIIQENKQYDELKAEHVTLHVVYVPKNFTIKFWYNGFGSEGTFDDRGNLITSGVDTSNGAFTIGRDYKTSLAYDKPGKDSTRTFDKWCDVSADGKGQTSSSYTSGMLVEKNLEFYATWTSTKGGGKSPAFQRPELAACAGLSLSATDHIDPNQVGATAYLNVTQRPAAGSKLACDPSGLVFSVKSGKQFVELKQSASDKRSATLTVKSTDGLNVNQWNFGQPIVVEVKDTNASGVAPATATITLRHTFSNGNRKVTQYPSCEQGGRALTKCDTCNVQKETTWAPDGHRNVSHTDEATCIAAGQKVTHCVVCGKNEIQTIPAKGHQFKVTNIRSCTGTTQEKVCEVCGYTETVSEGSGAQHSWLPYKITDIPATCNHAGSESTHCANCSARIDSEPIPVTGVHTYSNWTVDKPATPTTDGDEVRSCTACGAEEHATILATGKVGAEAANEKEKDVDFSEVLSSESSNPTQPSTGNENQGQGTKPTTPNNNGGNQGGASTPSGNTGGSGSGASTGSGSGSGAGGSTGTKPADPSDSVDKPSGDVTDVPDDAKPTDPVDSVVQPSKPSDTGTSNASGKRVYRLYNPYSTEHIYTTDLREWKNCITNGWHDETGSASYSLPEVSNTPVYRVYNQWSGEHHYTTDVNEKNVLVGSGWTDEGVAFYGADAGSVPVYRLFRGDGAPGAHHYTADAHERDVLASSGWSAEGISWSGI